MKRQDFGNHLRSTAYIKLQWENRFFFPKQIGYHTETASNATGFISTILSIYAMLFEMTEFSMLKKFLGLFPSVIFPRLPAHNSQAIGGEGNDCPLHH